MFSRVISDQRKKLGLSQKDLAARIRKEDGTPISAQYLNDMEHGRRKPPPDPILDQIARELGLKSDYLRVIAGRFPDDLTNKDYRPEKVEAALHAFRRQLKGK